MVEQILIMLNDKAWYWLTNITVENIVYCVQRRDEDNTAMNPS